MRFTGEYNWLIKCIVYLVPNGALDEYFLFIMNMMCVIEYLLFIMKKIDICSNWHENLVFTRYQ